jgi:tRNA A-37 threonylcarbamoyl transferase component Bud32
VAALFGEERGTVTRQEQLEDLLNRWEDFQDRGKPDSPEEICCDCPELLDELKQMIAKLQQIDGFLLAEPRANTAQLASAGRYQPLELHAQGGIGDVFRARDGELGRVVALKRIRMLDARNPARSRRFEFEAKITGHLEHPGIVPIYGFQRDAEGRLFYAMRMIRGGTLERAIDDFHKAYPVGHNSSEGSLALQKLLRSFLMVCETIGYAHSQGVIHRDLKPANIMVGEYGETLVVDWGLAKRVAGGEPSQAPAEFSAPETAFTETSASETAAAETVPSSAAVDETRLGDIKGSPAYMSPEQAAGDTAHIGASSDIYSLGATLYAVLTGHKAVGGSGLNELLENAKCGKFPRPRLLRGDIPQPLEAICLKAMSLNPRDRYATPIELATDIEHWLADEPVGVLREAWPKRAGRWIKRHRTFASAVGAALLVTLIALGAASAILGEKNRELTVANRTAEENFEQSHATLRNIIEFALHGRTLSDNVVLDPVRLDILQRAVEYAEQLRSRQRGNRELILENALLLISLGDVETRLGKGIDAREHYREARDLFGEPTAGESLDWRHGRALAKLRLAGSLALIAGQRSAESMSLLHEACEVLAAMAKNGECGSTVLNFGRDLEPESLLAADLALLPTLDQEERRWMEIAVERLERPGGSGSSEFTRAFLRGQWWYGVCCRISQKDSSSDEIRIALEKAIAAFDQADAAILKEKGHADATTNWIMAQCRAMQARLLMDRRKPADAIKMMRQACDGQRSLLPTINEQGDKLLGAWKAIDPSATPFTVGPSDHNVVFRLAYIENLSVLADMLHEQGDDARPVVAEAEKAIGGLKPSVKWPTQLRLKFAQSLVRIADSESDETSTLAQQYAEQARPILEAIRAPTEDNLEVDLPLLQAYLLTANAAIARKSVDALALLEKAAPLQKSLGRSTAPRLARRYAVKFGSLFAAALARTKPQHFERIWQVARDSLMTLETFADSDLDAADRERLRALTTHLAAAAMGWAMQVQDRRPVSKAEIAKICDPAIVALRRLKDRALLSDQDKQSVEILTTFRDAHYDKP